MARRRRVLLGAVRFFAWLVPGLALGGMALGLLGWLWLRTASGNDWLLAQVLPLVQPKAGTIEVARLRSDLWDEVVLEDVVVRDPEGIARIVVGRVEAEVALQSLIGRVVPIRALRLEGVDVQLDDPAVFRRMWPSDPTQPDTPWAGLPVEVLVDRLSLSGRASVKGQTFEGLRLVGGVTARGRQVSWIGLRLDATGLGGPVHLEGDGAWSPERTVLAATSLRLGPTPAGGENRLSVHGALVGETLALELDAVHLDFPALVAFVPQVASVPVATPLDLTGRVDGTLEKPVVSLEVQSSGGPLTLAASVLPAGREWTLDLMSPGLDTSTVAPGLEPLRFEGVVSAKGRGWTWPDDLALEGTVDARVVVRGEPLEARGPVALEGGKLQLSRVDTGGYGARANVSGEVDLLGKTTTLTVHGADAGLRRFGAEGRASFTGDVEAGWGEGVRVAAKGRLVGLDLQRDDAAVGGLQAEVDVGWDGRAPSGRATFVATSLRYADRRAASGRGTVELGERAEFTVQLDDPGAEVAFAEGSFHLAERRLHLDALRAALAPGVALVAEGVQTLRLVEGGVADADLHLRVGSAEITAKGGTNPDRHDTLVLAVQGLELHELDLAVPGKLSGWKGRVDTRLALVGTLAAPRWEGDVGVAGFAIPGQLEGLSANFAFEGQDASVRATGSMGSASAELVTLDATLPVRLSAKGMAWDEAGAIDGNVRLAPNDTELIATVFAGRKLPHARLSAELRLSGSLDAPVLGLTASADLPLATDGPTARAWLEASVDKGVGRGRLVLNQSFQSRMETNLALVVDTSRLVRRLTRGEPLPEAAALFTNLGGAVVLKHLPLDIVRRVVPFPGDVDGALAGAFAVTGSPFAPRLQGGINLLEARVGTLSVAPATLNLTPLPLGYKIETALGFAARPGSEARISCARKAGDLAGDLRVSGFLPLDETLRRDRPGLSLEVTGAGIPLAALEAIVPSVTDTAGCLAVGGRIGGTLAEPTVAVGMRLQGGAATVVPLGVRLEDMELDGRFQEGRLVVDAFGFRTESGRPRPLGAPSAVRGRGSLTLKGWEPAELEGRVTLEQAWLISRADRAVQVSGELQVSGRDRILDVAGRVMVDEGFLNFPSRFFARDGESGLHPDLRVVRSGAAPEAVSTDATAAPRFTLRPKVHIDLARHMRVAAALPLQGSYGDLARSLSTVRVDAELDGEVDLTSHAGALRLTGDVETTRGSAQILGRPFDLTGGTIAFTGADYGRPILDLTADHSVNCDAGPSLVRVAISGVPGAPVLDFSGEGELTDQDGILRALLLGTCPGDGGTDVASQDALVGLVAGMLADDLATTGQSLFQLESLDLDTTGSTRVSIALGRNLFLTTAYDPLADPTMENSFSVQVELALPYRWYLSIETGDRGVTAISSYRKFRF